MAPTTPSDLTVTTVGCLNLDVVAAVPTLPRAGQTVSGGTLTRHAGGKGANQAAALSRLGARSAILGAVGTDADGDRLRGELDAAGVTTAGLQRVDAPTGTALIVVDEAGENQIAVCPGANDHVELTASDLQSPTAVLCQLELGVALAERARSHTAGFFALNASPITRLPATLIDGCDLIVVNDHEYAQIAGLDSARLVAVTHGAGGASLYRAGERIASAPGQRVDVINTVGAGDAFCAAILIATLLKLDPAAGLTAACAAGAHAVTQAASQPQLWPFHRYTVHPPPPRSSA